MFTGIVEELGKAAGLDLLADSARLTIHAPLVAAGATAGSSIAVNGVCLTVTAADGDQFTADVMGETLARSTLGGLAPGAPVNLERPAPVGGRLGRPHRPGPRRRDRRDHREQASGSLARAADLDSRAGCLVMSLRRDRSLSTASASRCPGSARSAARRPADGEHWFEVSLIPETLTRTTLGAVAAGDQVNIEVDVIAKYVERLLAGGEQR